MVRIESNIQISCPVNQVFHYCTDVKIWPKWMGDEVEAEQTSNERVGAGSTFRGTIKGLGPRGAWVATVTKYEPDRECSYIFNLNSCHIEAYLTFASIESGTRLQLDYNFQGYGLLRLLAPLLKGAMKKRTDEGLESLKSILER